MRLLLDTHIFIWATLIPERLGLPLQNLLANPGHDRLLSSASVWELAIKNGTGRLHYPLDQLDHIMEDLGANNLPITNAHALAAGALPRHHNDPFDRMLVAQARTDGLFLVTVDPALSRYDVPILNG